MSIMLPAENRPPVRPAETTPETFKVYPRRGCVSINRYWWATTDGHHEVRFDVRDGAGSGDPWTCLNMEREQVRELRDQLTALLRATTRVVPVKVSEPPSGASA